MNRLDIVVQEEERGVCFIVDIACLFGIRVAEKEPEKISCY